MTPLNIRITAWTDEQSELTDLSGVPGYPARHPYVDLFWLPILGPSATALLKRLNMYLDDDHEGWTFNVNDLSRELGLGTSESKHSPLQRAISRLVQFNLARRSPSGGFAVRRVIAPLSLECQSRLSPLWQELHRHLVSPGRACDPALLANVPWPTAGPTSG